MFYKIKKRKICPSDFIIINSDFITLKLFYRYINDQFIDLLVFLIYNFPVIIIIIYIYAKCCSNLLNVQNYKTDESK